MTNCYLMGYYLFHIKYVKGGSYVHAKCMQSTHINIYTRVGYFLFNVGMNMYSARENKLMCKHLYANVVIDRMM